jgi:hypothetical protein
VTDETPTRPPKETWRDWHTRYAPHVPMPGNDELLTRDQLMADLRRLGVDVTERTIHNWQKQRVIPSPVRHTIAGASRAMYAPWVAYTIALADAERRRSRPVEEVAAAVRAKAGQIIAFADTHTQAWADLTEEMSAVLRKWANRYQDRHDVTPAFVQIAIWDHARTLISSYEMRITEKSEA